MVTGMSSLEGYVASGESLVRVTDSELKLEQVTQDALRASGALRYSTALAYSAGPNSQTSASC